VIPIFQKIFLLYKQFYRKHFCHVPKHVSCHACLYHIQRLHVTKIRALKCQSPTSIQASHFNFSAHTRNCLEIYAVSHWKLPVNSCKKLHTKHKPCLTKVKHKCLHFPVVQQWTCHSELFQTALLKQIIFKKLPSTFVPWFILYEITANKHLCSTVHISHACWEHWGLMCYKGRQNCKCLFQPLWYQWQKQPNISYRYIDADITFCSAQAHNWSTTIWSDSMYFSCMNL
jgi:hypothetical protein